MMVSVISWLTRRIYFLILTTSCIFYDVVEGEHHHHVTGPSQAVLARAGENVTLPCRIIEPSRRDAARLTVEWSRADLEPVYVHVRQQGHEVSHSVNPLYRHRAALFVPELPRGNISLMLSGARLSDEGSFKCFVPNLHSSTLVQLRVGLVSQPVIFITGPEQDDGGVFALTCDSGCWHPQPEVSWLDSRGGDLLSSADPPVAVRGPGDCYTVRRNVTVRAGAGRVTCRVHLPHINHTVETHHVIPFPDHNSTQPTSVGVMTVIRSIVTRNVIIGSVLASVGCIGGCIAGCIAYCLPRKKAVPDSKTSNGEENGGTVLEMGPMLGEQLEQEEEEEESVVVCTDDAG